jgi:membrane fusion protein (multidrug efflux system)
LGFEVFKYLSIALAAGAALVAGAFLLAGWSGAAKPPRAAVTPPPPEVGVIVTQAVETPLPFEYAGRVVGFRNVEVRPRVGGLLLTRDYVEGAKVKEGDVLFRIDPATYEVALSRAEAQRQQAQATLRQAEENFKRIDQLSSKAIATERQLDDAVAQRDQARASVQLAEAEIRNARLNLDYTTVIAPASGVTALQSPPVGTLIQAQQTLLTTITRLDPAYVMFSFTDTEAQDFRELNQRRAKPIVAEDLTVELHYSNGAIYPHTGKIDQAAQRVDLQTGTIEARAIFPNPDGALIPGQFVRIVIKGVTLQDAIVIPSQAVNQGPQGPSVFVVGDNNAAQAKLVRLGQEVAGGLVVQNGLKSGEQVIVDGVIRVRPGAPVKPVPVSPPASTQTMPAAAANTEGARP